MKKKIIFLFMLSISALLLFACAPEKLNGPEVRRILENAVFSPEQAYAKYKTFYMRTERLVIESSSADMYIDALNKESYDMNSLFENKVVQELYIQDNTLRLSSYVESFTMPLELHLIYDGETLHSISNFAKNDSQKMTFQQAQNFICFPHSDFFRRIRADFEQSGKEIEYRYAGTQKYNGHKCYILEMGLKGDNEKKAVFFVDPKTNIVVKSGWSGVFPNNCEVKKINKTAGEKVPAIVEMFYGQYFTAIVKYFVRVNENIHPDIFKEGNILLPLRSMYQDRRFLEERIERRRARIRVVLDSVQSFDVVLSNMHLDSADDGFASADDKGIKAIEIPELEARLIPDNTAPYRIPIASVEQEEERKKKLKVKPKPKPKPKPKKAPEPVRNENDETDWLEYNPSDAYKSIEAELEEMKERDPEEYEKMKKIVEEMKMKDANIQNLSN